MLAVEVTGMVELGAGSGVKILGDGQRLVVCDTRTGPLHTAAFVLALLALIPAGGGVALLVAGPRALAPAAAILTAFGALCGLGLALILRVIRRRRAAPFDALTPLVVIDLVGRRLLDGGGRALAPLARVRFHRQRQLGSSEPALVASFANTTLVLARGNPFAGGLGTLERALHRAGLMPG
jgi:hypothetical protein